MSDSPWREVLSAREIPAAASGGSWTPALDYVPGGTLLKITSEGTWRHADEDSALVGPEGDATSPVPTDNLLNAKAPVGALVAKIGGSTAEKDGAHSFVVGSYCVLEVPDEKGGALMFAMNNAATARGGSSGALRVTISRYEVAPSPQKDLHVADEASS